MAINIKAKLGSLFSPNTNTKIDKSTKVNIHTDSDTMFKIGRDLGEIKAGVKSNVKELNYIKSKLKEHDTRLKELETLIKKEK